jgi:hypothetical protein
MLEEAAQILRTIKSGWDEMPEEFRKMRKEQIDRLAA